MGPSLIFVLGFLCAASFFDSHVVVVVGQDANILKLLNLGRLPLLGGVGRFDRSDDSTSSDSERTTTADAEEATTTAAAPTFSTTPPPASYKLRNAGCINSENKPKYIIRIYRYRYRTRKDGQIHTFNEKRRFQLRPIYYVQWYVTSAGMVHFVRIRKYVLPQPSRFRSFKRFSKNGGSSSADASSSSVRHLRKSRHGGWKGRRSRRAADAVDSSAEKCDIVEAGTIEKSAFYEKFRVSSRRRNEDFDSWKESHRDSDVESEFIEDWSTAKSTRTTFPEIMIFEDQEVETRKQIESISVGSSEPDPKNPPKFPNDGEFIEIEDVFSEDEDGDDALSEANASDFTSYDSEAAETTRTGSTTSGGASGSNSGTPPGGSNTSSSVSSASSSSPTATSGGKSSKNESTGTSISSTIGTGLSDGKGKDAAQLSDGKWKDAGSSMSSTGKDAGTSTSSSSGVGLSDGKWKEAGSSMSSSSGTGPSEGKGKDAGSQALSTSKTASVAEKSNSADSSASNKTSGAVSASPMSAKTAAEVVATTSSATGNEKSSTNNSDGSSSPITATSASASALKSANGTEGRKSATGNKIDMDNTHAAAAGEPTNGSTSSTMMTGIRRVQKPESEYEVIMYEYDEDTEDEPAAASGAKGSASSGRQKVYQYSYVDDDDRQEEPVIAVRPKSTTGRRRVYYASGDDVPGSSSSRRRVYKTAAKNDESKPRNTQSEAQDGEEVVAVSGSRQPTARRRIRYEYVPGRQAQAGTSGSRRTVRKKVYVDGNGNGERVEEELADRPRPQKGTVRRKFYYEYSDADDQSPSAVNDYSKGTVRRAKASSGSGGTTGDEEVEYIEYDDAGVEDVGADAGMRGTSEGAGRQRQIKRTRISHGYEEEPEEQPEMIYEYYDESETGVEGTGTGGGAEHANANATTTKTTSTGAGARKGKIVRKRTHHVQPKTSGQSTNTKSHHVVRKSRVRSGKNGTTPEGYVRRSRIITVVVPKKSAGATEAGQKIKGNGSGSGGSTAIESSATPTAAGSNGTTATTVTTSRGTMKNETSTSSSSVNRNPAPAPPSSGLTMDQTTKKATDSSVAGNATIKFMSEEGA